MTRSGLWSALAFYVAVVMTFVVTVSIGIATYPDDRVTDSASLLRLADQNLLKAKADGRNRYRD